ncbi:40S ribosomal protein S3 [Homalodisca vitripennis]|nr:40S ribosomal protein S3 [Homalodisca vitripennis]
MNECSYNPLTAMARCGWICLVHQFVRGHAATITTRVLGIKVKIMLPFDPDGKIGPKKPLPDNIFVVEPKEETLPTIPTSDHKASAKPDTVVPAAIVA